MKLPLPIVAVTLCALAACQRSAPAELNPLPAEVAHVAPVASVPEASETPPLPILGYAEQAATIPAGGRAAYAVTLTEIGDSWPAPTIRVVWQWLDTANVLAGGPTAVPVPSPAPDAHDSMVRFEIIAPQKPGDYVLKVWLARSNGASLEPLGAQPLHYSVQVQ